jgi:putative transposase
MTTTSTVTPELLDQLLANYKKPEDLTGEDGLFKQLKRALIERALGAELTEHLGYEKGDPAGRCSGNSRNGTSSKTVLTEDGEIEIAIPRDLPAAKRSCPRSRRSTGPRMPTWRW